MQSNTRQRGDQATRQSDLANHKTVEAMVFSSGRDILLNDLSHMIALYEPLLRLAVSLVMTWPCEAMIWTVLCMTTCQWYDLESWEWGAL